MDGMPPPGAGGPSGGPGLAAPPSLPKSPVGGPGGPGGSPMMSPGSGPGAKAEATQKVKVAIPTLLLASLAYEPGSKEQQALLRAISALNPIFGKAEGANMVPAGIAAMGQSAQKGPPMAAPPPGVAGGEGPPGAPPGMPPPMAEAA